MTDPLVVGVGLFGLAVGSFLNVCIHRLPRGESVVAPPSRCPACGQRIRWFDNVPVVAYLALRGRCRHCRAAVSPLYPLVEAATPVLFLLQYREVGFDPLLAPRLLFTAAMVALFAIDLRHRLLPDAITLPGIAAGMVFALFLDPGWMDAAIGAVAGGGSLFLIAEIYYRIRGRRHKEGAGGGRSSADLSRGLGEGDIKMLAMIGAFLGFELAYVTLLWASLLGVAIGLGMIGIARVDWKYPFPLGSFLAVAAVAASVVGDAFLHWSNDFIGQLLHQYVPSRYFDFVGQFL